MGFLSITTHNFRNLENQCVHTDRREVFLVGDNGQGKTNFVEAVYLLCYGSSFRTKRDKLLINHGCDAAWIRGVYSFPSGSEMTIVVKIERGKDILVNGKRIQDRKELIENVPCIIFSHDDIQFIKGPPERQRWFFNQIMSMFDSYFIDMHRNYRKIITMRNNQLREQNSSFIDVYDTQLSGIGMEIQKKREISIQEFNETFTALFSDITDLDTPVEIRYFPSWKAAEKPEDAVKVLQKTIGRDREYGTTTSGPHRDKIRFIRDGMDFAKTASTGQLRLMSLALRVAQSIYYREKTGREPLLLLDDVLLELDTEKRKKFVTLLPDYEQAFFTFLPDEQYLVFKKEETADYLVAKGKITEKHETSA
jgi:DNA replication and repair protein RecF